VQTNLFVKLKGNLLFSAFLIPLSLNFLWYANNRAVLESR
jgi:hypothetical protein